MAAVMLLCLSSCSQDDIPGIGKPLPDGMYPLNLTATIGASRSRAESKDSWVGGEEIAVNISGNTAKYIIHTSIDTYGNAKANAIPSDTPLYWQNTASSIVRAWYPYAESDRIYTLSDQSEGYADFDLLYAETEGAYDQPVQLDFGHRLAKVNYTLVRGTGLSEAEFDRVTVTLSGSTSVTVNGNGNITRFDTIGDITPCSDDASHSGSALLVPQDMTGKPFIKVRVDDLEFVYTPDAEAAADTLKAGYSYSYKINVKATGIEVTEVTGAWSDGETENAGIDISYNGTEPDAKLGDYYYDDGTWSDGGLRKLCADGTTEWADPRPAPLSGKTLIAIVFYVGQHENDKSDYSSTGIRWQKCHGYAVALKDASHNTSNENYCEAWGPKREIGCSPVGINNKESPDLDWNGYAWTQKIISEAGGTDKLSTNESGYPATYYAVKRYEEEVKAPSNSSGWFLPSIGQMWYIYQKRNDLFKYNSSQTQLTEDWYWTSSEYNDLASHSSGRLNYALVVVVNQNRVSSYFKTKNDILARSVLAF